jgi:uncharacterized membrane protein YhiD involved in acid resistance
MMTPFIQRALGPRTYIFIAVVAAIVIGVGVLNLAPCLNVYCLVAGKISLLRIARPFY